MARRRRAHCPPRRVLRVLSSRPVIRLASRRAGQRAGAVSKRMLAMRLIAFLALLAAFVAGCSTAPSQESAANPNAPLCAFSGLTPASPEWPGCLALMALNPNRHLLVAVIKAR